jgi:glycosyltransferase involved in cell wall biosynthesis
VKRYFLILSNFCSRNFNSFVVTIRSSRFFERIESNERAYQFLKSLYRFINRPVKTLPEIAFKYQLLKPVTARTIYCDVSGIFDVPFLDGTRRVGKYFVQNLLNLNDANYRVIPVVWDGKTYVDKRKTHKVFGLFSSRRFEWNPRENDLLFIQTMEAVSQIGPSKLRQISKRVKVVTFIHDILPIREPNWFTNRMANTFVHNLESALEASQSLVVSSKVVEGDLRALTASSDNRTRIPAIARVNIASVAQKFASKQRIPKVIMPEAPLVILLISTIEPRKGYDELVSAATQAILEGANLKFVIVGRLGWVSDSFRADFTNFVQAFNGRIQWHENATDQEVSDFVEEADIFLSPTRGEGFGIPVTEALISGLPALVRGIPVYRELYGDVVAVFGDDGDFPDLYTALMNPEKLYEISSIRATKFTPGDPLDSFNALMTVFREL